MNNKVKRSFSFLMSLVMSFVLFLIPAIPVFSILTEDIAQTSSNIAPVEKADDTVILLGIEESGALRLFAVEFFFNQASFDVKEIQQNSISEESFLSYYNYSGASYLLEKISGFYPENIEKYVILDNNWAKKFLDFFGGAIVTEDNSYYNDKNEQVSYRILGAGLSEGFQKFGTQKVVRAIVKSAIGDNEQTFYNNAVFIFENADTNISYSDFVKSKNDFNLLRR